MLKALVVALALQSAPDWNDGGAIYLISQHDTAWLIAEGSIRREESRAFMTLVAVYPTGPEPYDSIRADMDIEVDCTTRALRFVRARSFDAEGGESTDDVVSDWTGEDFPPFDGARIVGCDSVDYSSAIHPSLPQAVIDFRIPLDERQADFEASGE